MSCDICLVDWYDGNVLGHLICGHSFHLECIKSWIKTSSRCPICSVITGLAYTELYWEEMDTYVEDESEQSEQEREQSELEPEPRLASEQEPEPTHPSEQEPEPIQHSKYEEEPVKKGKTHYEEDELAEEEKNEI